MHIYYFIVLGKIGLQGTERARTSPLGYLSKIGSFQTSFCCFKAIGKFFMLNLMSWGYIIDYCLSCFRKDFEGIYRLLISVWDSTHKLSGKLNWSISGASLWVTGKWSNTSKEYLNKYIVCLISAHLGSQHIGGCTSDLYGLT